MLGLPSTTEVDVRLPKEAFYRNMRIDASTKRAFVEGVESIEVANSVKPTTANVADGDRIHEIMVVAVVPRGEGVPERVARTIFAANKARIVVADATSGELLVEDRGKIRRAPGVARLDINGVNLDEVWSSILAQIVLGEPRAKDILARIDRHEKMEALRAEVIGLDKSCRKERQIARKNELFARMREKKAELERLERE